MTSPMAIQLEWLPPFHGAEEIRRTSAMIEIRFGAKNATRCEDAWSQSVQQGARVAAYPLALWLASSWWRIRWEPRPSGVRLGSGETAAGAGWRMSHELPAAGYGFLWPLLTFSSDGETIEVNCRSSPDSSEEPVRFLSEFDLFVPAKAFEYETDKFLDLVLRRLDSLGETELHVLWRQVLDERTDPAQSEIRRIEARLGFEPDDAPEPLLEEFLGFASSVGSGAADEIAPVCAGSRPGDALREIQNFASRPGITGKAAIPGGVALPDHDMPPWMRGQKLAQELRQSLGLNDQPVQDASLAELLTMSATHLDRPEAAANAPMGLAIQAESGSELKLLFRKKNRQGRRFEAARFIADYLCAGASDRWLPVTDAATARQKLQRAFAAEFLCPIEALRSYLGDEFNTGAFEDAAEHFGISEIAVRSHLANHHLIPRALVDQPIVA